MTYCDFFPDRTLMGTDCDLFGVSLYAIISRNIRYMAGKFSSILSKEDMQDLVSDTYIKVLDKREQYDPEKNFEGWVYRICQHSVWDLTKKRSRLNSRFRSLEDEDCSYAAEEASHADRKAIHDESIQRMWSIFGQLKPEEREIAIMLMEETPYKEMAKAVGCSDNTLKTKVCRTRKTLREMGLAG